MNEETSLYCFNELLPKSIHNVLFVSELVTGFFFVKKKNSMETCRMARFKYARPPDKSAYWIIFFCSSKTYVVGTQKNCLNETVLLSTQNTCLN